VFLLLALVHVYWALGGRAAWDASVPEIHGRRAFTPSAGITVAVAGALFACAGLVAATSRLFDVPVPARVLTWLTFGLSFLLFLRAVPLCLALALGVFVVAYANHA
jgi:hypothetical protein